MSPLSLRDAAQQVGVSKSTLLRAIHSGRMTAPRTDDGGYLVDEAELRRAYPVAPKAAAEPVEASPAAADVELVVRNARLEAELAALKSLLEAERRRGEELREDRDRWFRQAERTTGPAPAPALKPLPSHPGALGDVMGRLFRRSA